MTDPPGRSSSPSTSTAASEPIAPDATVDGLHESHEDRPIPPLGESAEEERPGIREQVKMLYREARALVDAELSFQRNRASYIGKQAKHAVGMAIVGVTFIIGSMLALILGALLGLAPLVGPWAAMAIVVLISAAIAFIAFKTMIGRIKAIGRVLTSDPMPGHGDGI